MFDQLIRFLSPSRGGHEEWGRSEAPTPTDPILRGWGQRVGASEGGRQAGRPAVRPKPASSASRAAAHNRPCGAKAGARAAAVMPSATLRRTGAARAADQLLGRCTLHVPSARRPLPRCLPRAPTYIYSYTSPTGRRRRAAAASCARTSARRALSHNRRPVPAPVRARLRARGWVPGRGASGESQV